MRVDHRSPNVGMAQQLLNGADITARLEEVGGKTMAKRMATCRLLDPRLAHCCANGTLYGLLVNMMANGLSGIHILTKRSRGKYVVPTSMFGVLRKFLRQRTRQRHTRITRCALLVEAKVQFLKMHAQRLHDRCG